MVRPDNITIQVTMQQNKMKVVCTPVEDGEYLYAFQLFCDGRMVDRVLYSEQNETIFWLSHSGDYTVRACMKQGEASTKRDSSPVHYVRPPMPEIAVTEVKTSILHKVRYVCDELVRNSVMMLRVARYDYKLSNKDSRLGILWGVLTPLIQIGIYWLVFGLGIRNGASMDGHPFLLWMLCGLVPWFVINEGIMKGAGSIYSKASIATKMKYPITTIPVGIILTAFMEHLITLVILLGALAVSGYYPTFYYFNLIYYILYNFVFLCSLSMITSVLTMIARDFQKLLANIVKLLFYVTPILWSMESMPKLYQDILQVNPVLYVVEGFRDSLLYNVPFYQHPGKLLFFWGVNAVLFLIGCDLQYKYRKRINDLL